MGHWAQNESFTMAVPVLWPEPIENEWGELKRGNTNMELWIWRIWSDSGWRNGLWSLVRCSPNSSGIIGENSELLSLEKDVAIIGLPIIVANMNWRKHYSTMRFSPPLSIVLLQWYIRILWIFGIKDQKDEQCRFIFHSRLCSYLPRCQY